MNVELFVRLFRGRGDARGSWAGRSIREPLTPEHFARHLASPHEWDWIGVYNVVRDDNCSWGCVDIDEPDLELARNIELALWRQHIPSWIEATTHGYHVWVFPAEPVVPAATMRQALTAACRAVRYVPKEVFPKQIRLGPGQLGNYVRLPLNGADAPVRIAATRRFIDSPPLSMMDEERAPTAHLERVAAMLPAPQAVRISVDIDAGLEYSDIVRKIGKLPYRIWRDGPLHGEDRSDTLCSLAHHLFKSDVDANTAYGIITSADDRWGKGFVDRGEAGVQIMQQIVANAYGNFGGHVRSGAVR